MEGREGRREERGEGRRVEGGRKRGGEGRRRSGGVRDREGGEGYSLVRGDRWRPHPCAIAVSMRLMCVHVYVHSARVL